MNKLLRKIKSRLARPKKASTHVNFMEYVASDSGILLPGFFVDSRFPEKGKKYVKIGQNTMIDAACIFETPRGEIEIKPNTFVGRSTFICRSRIEVGSNVFIAWGCYFYDHDSHSSNYLDRRNDISQQIEDYKAGRNFITNKNWDVVKTKPIIIHDDVWIGMNCIILKGVTIGRGAIIGAGSVVASNIEPWTVYAGNPAVKIKELPVPEI